MFHNTSYPHLISTPLRAPHHLFTSYLFPGDTPGALLAPFSPSSFGPRLPRAPPAFIIQTPGRRQMSVPRPCAHSCGASVAMHPRRPSAARREGHFLQDRFCRVQDTEEPNYVQPTPTSIYRFCQFSEQKARNMTPGAARSVDDRDDLQGAYIRENKNLIIQVSSRRFLCYIGG